jgi:hypothetical protein
MKEQHPFFDELKDYLTKSKLKIIDAKGFTLAVRVVHDRDNKEPQKDYYIERYLEDKEDKNWGQQILGNFVMHLLSTGKFDQKKILSFITSRLPIEDKYGNNYDKYTKPLLATLAKNQELLYGFVSRKGFLSKHFNDMPAVIKLIELPRLKEALFAQLLEHKDFNTVKSQNLFLSMVSEHSKNAEKYYPLLTKLKLTNDKKDNDILTFVEKKSYLLHFDLIELNSKSGNKYRDADELRQICKNFMIRIMDLKDILGLDFYQVREDNNQIAKKQVFQSDSWDVTLVGNHPNLKIISQIFPTFLEKAFQFESAYGTAGVEIDRDYIQSLVEKDKLENSVTINMGEPANKKTHKI